MRILEEFWYGNIKPTEYDTNACKEYKEVLRLITRNEEKLQAITTLQTLVVALGAGLGVWGVVNLLEGYGSDNPGSNAHVR